MAFFFGKEYINAPSETYCTTYTSNFVAYLLTYLNAAYTLGYDLLVSAIEASESDFKGYGNIAIAAPTFVWTDTPSHQLTGTWPSVTWNYNSTMSGNASEIVTGWFIENVVTNNIVCMGDVNPNVVMQANGNQLVLQPVFTQFEDSAGTPTPT
jgi:hypothetical protein